MEPGEWQKQSVPNVGLKNSSEVLFRTLPARLRFSADEKRIVKSFARDLSERLAGGSPFTCLITNDRELQALNNSFLGHDYPTDVLSFPSLSGDVLGEVAISAEHASAQALEFGHTLLDEVRVLMLHGVLHLAGFDHERDQGKMARAENKWRSEFQLPLTLLKRHSYAGAGQ